MPQPVRLLSGPIALDTVRLLSTREDDFEFDFFDEPDEETVTQRRAAGAATSRGRSAGPRRPRGPAGPPTGLTPILRLVGLIAAAIVVVVLLVFWIQGCQNDAKANAYKDYMADVSSIAKASTQIGRTLNSILVTPGIKEKELETKLNGLAQQEQQNVARAQSLDPPGHLREVHQHLIEALQLRVSGLRGLADAFKSTAKLEGLRPAREPCSPSRRSGCSRATSSGTTSSRRPRRRPSTRRASTAWPCRSRTSSATVDIASAATFAEIVKRIKGAATGGTF